MLALWTSALVLVESAPAALTAGKNGTASLYCIHATCKRQTRMCQEEGCDGRTGLECSTRRALCSAAQGDAESNTMSAQPVVFVLANQNIGLWLFCTQGPMSQMAGIC